MALTVEDGSGLADADAYVSVADCDAYCEARGLTDWTDVADSPADTKEAAIRRATDHLSSAYAWKGAKRNGRTQAQAWPRIDVEDGEGEEVASDEVPVEVIQACCELAAYEVANPGGLSPTVTLHNRVKAKGVGPLRKEFFAAPMTAEAVKPVLTRVDALIGGLITGRSSSLFGEAMRG